MRALQWAPVLAIALLASASASAQGNPFRGDPDATGSLGPLPRGQVIDRATGQVCQRWCEWDDLPCDPPNFKIADGRCRPFNNGRW
ncbi:MAG: hypothetical protein PGN34_05400 [Methylobacterium frigidaeris]